MTTKAGFAAIIGAPVSPLEPPKTKSPDDHLC